MGKDKKEAGKRGGSGLIRFGCLAFLLLAVGAGALVWYASKRITTHPGKAKAVANSFLDFELPEGYEMEYAGELMGVKIASFGRAGKDDQGKAFSARMIWFPGGGKGEESEEIELDVGDKEVKAIKTVRTDEETGEKKILIRFTVEGKGGPVAVYLEGPEEDFDEDAVEDFLDSID